MIPAITTMAASKAIEMANTCDTFFRCSQFVSGFSRIANNRAKHSGINTVFRLKIAYTNRTNPKRITVLLR